jgi:uncharacterized protein YutE (UPF0331/DUF86 family)
MFWFLVASIKSFLVLLLRRTLVQLHFEEQPNCKSRYGLIHDLQVAIESCFSTSNVIG